MDHKKKPTTEASRKPAVPAPCPRCAVRDVQAAQHRVAIAQHHAALAALHAELIGLHGALGVRGSHAGSVRDRVFAVLKDLGAEGDITTNATVTGLNLANDTVRHALNSEFFPGQNAGLSDEQVKDDTSVGTLILEIHDLLGQ